MRRQIKTFSLLHPRLGWLPVLYWGRHDRPPVGAPMAVGPGALPPGIGVAGRRAVSRRPGDPPALRAADRPGWRPPYEIRAIGNIRSMRGPQPAGRIRRWVDAGGHGRRRAGAESLTLPPYRGPLRFRNAMPIRP